MKTRALTLLLAAAVGIAACQTGRQTPPPPAPQPDPGTGTASPQPNPNPEPPSPPVPTPAANVSAASDASVPSLAAAIPDQPVVAEAPVAPEALARPHEDILELKRAGLSDELILKKVQSENVNYHLTTAEVVELRAAGLSEAILEAMLRSGQAQPSAR